MNLISLDSFEPPEKTRGDCTEQLGYMEWHADAERRHKRGERQVWCEGCERWKWRLCEAAKQGQKRLF